MYHFLKLMNLTETIFKKLIEQAKHNLSMFERSYSE